MKYFPTRYFALFAMFLGATLLCGSGCTQQQTFDSPDHAADALVSAIRGGSQEQLEKMLGPDAEDILSSGDEIADQNAAERFISAYDEKHQLTEESNGSYTIVVGNNNWPMPIPIVKGFWNRWHFDTAAGKDEIVNRRIGQNELDVIQVCQAVVDAQREYATSNPGGGAYAQKFLSDQGMKNGLYWPTAEGEKPSPLGPLVAEAVDQGYSSAANTTDEPRPYHGYCYHMLKSQGANALGGARDYMVDGKMTGGFAAIAYPADYGNSGIMTFMVSQEGIVYQKDLGDDTESIAKSTTSFDPGEGWEPIASDVATGSKP